MQVTKVAKKHFANLETSSCQRFFCTISYSNACKCILSSSVTRVTMKKKKKEKKAKTKPSPLTEMYSRI